MRIALLALLLMSMCSALMAADATMSQSTGTVIVPSMSTMVPVVTNKNTASLIQSGQQSVVLVPMVVDSATMNRLMTNSNIVVAMTPVSVPVIVSSQTMPGATGAGPANAMTMDQVLANRNITFVPLMTPTTMDQATISRITGGQTVSIDQTMANDMLSSQQSIAVMPVVVASSSAGTMAGRGPASSIIIDSATMNKMMSSGSAVVYVPMVMDNQVRDTIVSSGKVNMMLPTMTSVTIQPSSSCK